MKKLLKRALPSLAALLLATGAWAGDTCIFTVTADSVPPNVLLLLDNGAEMENITWHQDYNDSFVYSAPWSCDQWSLDYYGDGFYSFCNPHGYAIQAGQLRRVKADLSIDTAGGINLLPDSTLPLKYNLQMYSSSYTFTIRDPLGVVVPSYTIDGHTYNTQTYSSGGTWTGDVVGKFVAGATVRGLSSTATAVINKVNGAYQQPATNSARYAFWDNSGYTYSYDNDRWAYVDFMATMSSTADFLFDTGTWTGEKLQVGTGGAAANGDLTYRWNNDRRRIALPQIPSAAVDADGIKDNATVFRYTQNYLNWLHFNEKYDANGGWVDWGDNYAGTGADLPRVSRFYYAKMAVMETAKVTGNKATFGLRNFTATSVGSSSVQPLGFVVGTVHADPNQNVLTSNFINNVNNMGTVTYSPLAEGLASVGGVFAGNSISGYVSDYYCQKHFAIVVSAGYSSKDLAPSSQGIPGTLTDFDKDGVLLGPDGNLVGEGNLLVDGIVHPVPVRLEGSSFLDDVAYYLHTTDMIPYRAGFQNVWTYTVGTGTSDASRRFLISTSNNGNGNYNLADSSNPEYGRYHFDAKDPRDLSASLMAALNSILSRTATFTAPVVPVTRTTSGDLIYLAFFKPLADNFWEGNITKFGLGAGNVIEDKNGNPATWPNGAMRDDAEPYWETKRWGDPSSTNFVPNATRNIYTFTGSSLDLTAPSNEFKPSNGLITEAILGTPQKTNSAHPGESARTLLINYIRGADSFDQNNNGSISENRRVIHADALHGEPVIVPYGNPNNQRRMVYFSANDGMLHAVYDENGKEAWGFIPPDQLYRLRELTEGLKHPYYIDSSPKVFLDDKNGDGYIDHNLGERAILMVGYRKGGKGYFALDISNPDSPKLLWRMADRDPGYSGIVHFTESITSWTNVIYGDFWASGQYADGSWYYLYGSTYYDELTSGMSMPYVWGHNLRPGEAINDLYIYRYYTNGTTSNVGPISATIDRIEQFGYATDSTNSLRVVYGLGQTWSEPVFARVKTSNDFYSDTETFYNVNLNGDTAKCSPTAQQGTNAFKACLVANPSKWKQVAIFGGGYDPRGISSWWSGIGSFVYFADIYTGNYVQSIWTGRGAIPSAVSVIDAGNNGFIDKVYVGDMGGNVWRIGQFGYHYDEKNGTLIPDNPETPDLNESIPPFPKTNENVSSWTAGRLYSAGCDEMGGSCTNYIDDDGDLLVDEYRRFFYPPDVALEKGFDLLLFGAGDRETACNVKTQNRIYVIKDDHYLLNLTESQLVNVTAGGVPDLFGVDKGFYLVLPDGDKVLAEGVLFYKVFYVTVFSPSTTDPCSPGGVTYLYTFNYRTGAAGADMDGDGISDLATLVGGGIGSKPVVIIRDGEKTGMLISVGSTNPDDSVGSTTGAGVIQANPLAPDFNFNMLWWREMF